MVTSKAHAFNMVVQIYLLQKYIYIIRYSRKFNVIVILGYISKLLVGI